MVSKSKVILNCRSSDSIRPELKIALQGQISSFDLTLLQSSTCPNRLSQIQNQNDLYFFFDEDIELPSQNYLECVRMIFQKNPQLQVLGGKYLSPSVAIPYLSRCYNSLIELWLFAENQKDAEVPMLCQNLPGGAWIVSGSVKKFLDDWKEPMTWAGEDTFSIRWLQKNGIEIYHHPAADVFHYPRSQFFYFCKRAFLQGQARAKFQLKSEYKKINLKVFLKYKIHWPGWALHQFFVEFGCFFSNVKSLIARKKPAISPVA